MPLYFAGVTALVTAMWATMLFQTLMYRLYVLFQIISLATYVGAVRAKVVIFSNLDVSPLHGVLNYFLGYI